ncbi:MULTISPECIES: hypothetical protein [unclassified Novosphingobium]|uniref:hypothetical protein n=1 Tax=unclassified Novosphingobium TaxID=2644732 RepID=UPI0025D832DB|nr:MULTISPECIES: hypothetical protein [unclassified Novosphingobium]HQS68520.1 hypothetical protein [Novosphingobium sp.]
MQPKTLQWQFVTFARILFAIHLLYSGGAYIFFGWVPSAFFNPASPVGRFMVELDTIGLYPLVKYLEFTLGLFALANRFTPLVAVMEFPITIMIAYLNLFVEGAIAPRHYYTGVQELAINVAVLLGYGAYYRSMLNARNAPKWLWQSADERPPAAERSASQLPIWLIFAGLMAVVMAASWFLGSADRRLPPRDWLPPVLSFVTMLALMRVASPAVESRI